MSAYRALVTDFGGVLTTPMQDSIVAFADSVGIEPADFARVALGAYSGGQDPLVVMFETGRLSEDEFTRALSARLREQTQVEIEPDGLVARIFATLELEVEMLDAVAAVRAAGFKTALVSNSWGVDGYPKDRLDGLFDAVVISGEVGLRKPDEAIFTLACDRLGVTATECVFVDDYPGHLDAARRLGMATVLHRSVRSTIAEVAALLGIDLG